MHLNGTANHPSPNGARLSVLMSACTKWQGATPFFFFFKRWQDVREKQNRCVCVSAHLSFSSAVSLQRVTLYIHLFSPIFYTPRRVYTQPLCSFCLEPLCLPAPPSRPTPPCPSFFFICNPKFKRFQAVAHSFSLHRQTSDLKMTCAVKWRLNRQQSAHLAVTSAAAQMWLFHLSCVMHGSLFILLCYLWYYVEEAIFAVRNRFSFSIMSRSIHTPHQSFICSWSKRVHLLVLAHLAKCRLKAGFTFLLTTQFRDFPHKEGETHWQNYFVVFATEFIPKGFFSALVWLDSQICLHTSLCHV